MMKSWKKRRKADGLPPCGGSGLKFQPGQRYRLLHQSLPPCGGSGLKSVVERGFHAVTLSPSMRREWIEIPEVCFSATLACRLPPCGGSGLKFFAPRCRLSPATSPSMRREWIEMIRRNRPKKQFSSPSMRREWIEMYNPAETPAHAYRLPPCGGSGLKFLVSYHNLFATHVSLHAEGVD